MGRVQRRSQSLVQSTTRFTTGVAQRLQLGRQLVELALFLHLLPQTLEQTLFNLQSKFNLFIPMLAKLVLDQSLLTT